MATEHGLRTVPRNAKGQWNAEQIFKRLESKGIKAFPSPSIIRKATEEEARLNRVKLTVEGCPDRRITRADLILMYQNIHRWLHELNPYTTADRGVFQLAHEAALWEDLAKLEMFISKHLISISGEGFFCTLRDDVDGGTKVLPLSKVGEIGG